MSTIVKDMSAFKQGIQDISTLVASTMGPYGTNVMPTGMEMQSIIFRDGAWVIRSYYPKNEIERNAVSRIRDAAQATLNAAGDGTSTTTVLLAAIYLKAMQDIESRESAGKTILRRLVTDRIGEIISEMIAYLEKAAIKVITYPKADDGLGGMSAAVTGGEIDIDLLRKVATIAGNNTAEIGNSVADLIAQIGAGGSIQVEISKSGTLETTVVPGYVFDAGLHHASFLPIGSRLLELEKPYIVLVQDTLATFEEFKVIAEGFNQHSFLLKENRPCVLICSDLTGVALGTSISRDHVDASGRPTGLKVPFYAIKAPLNVSPDIFFEDLAAVTGARVFNKTKGSRLSDFNWKKDAGSAEYLTSSQQRTTVRRWEKMSTVTGRLTYEGLIARVKQDLEQPGVEDAIVETIKKRLSALQGSIGVIRIPGETQGAVIWKKEVVEDSYLAAQNALKHGVLPGAGRALLAAYWHVTQKEDREIAENAVALDAVYAGVQEVFRAVMGNAGIDPRVIDLMIDTLRDTPFHHTFSLDRNLVLQARAISDGMIPVVDSHRQGLFGKIEIVTHTQFPDNAGQIIVNALVGAQESGVLDSANAVTSALKHSSTELSLWLNTKFLISEHV